MGQFSATHLGAVGLGGLLFSFVYWNFGFLRMGTTGMTAQAYGAEDQPKAMHIWLRAMIIALLVGGLLLLVMHPLSNIGFKLLGAQESSLDLLGEYFYARIWAAPATMALMVLTGWFFGMQNAIYPLLLTLVANVLNIAFNIYLVKHLNWGMSGVAWGTVWAQYISLFIGLIIFWKKYGKSFNGVSLDSIFQWKEWMAFLTINRDIFIRTIFLTLAFALFYRQSSIAGETILAINVILLQFVNWMSYGIDGFAYAAESLVGKYKGAKNDKLVYRAVRKSFVFGMGLACCFTFVYAFAGHWLASIFTPDAELLKALDDYLIWIILMPILATPSYIWDGIYIGLTASRAMRNSMTLAFVFCIVVWFFTQSLGNHGLWLSLMGLLVGRAIFQHYLFARKKLELT